MSEEIASADSLIRENAALRNYIERLRRWGTRLLKVIDTHPDLIPVYAASLKWRIDGPPPPLDDEDPTEVGTLLNEVARLRAALAWYADVGNYDERFAPGVLDPQQGTWHVDCGSRARAALSGAPDDSPL